MELVRTLSIRFSLKNRQRKLDFLEEFISNRRIKSCLIVGAANSNEGGYGNLIERGLFEFCETVVVSGLEKDSFGWENWISCDALDLPFADKRFDLVVSNAVIEHVGDEVAQKKFVSEHVRVGKHWVYTTPNRFFPVESHSHTFFSHYSTKKISNLYTRLLSRSDIIALGPRDKHVIGRLISPTFIVTCSC